MTRAQERVPAPWLFGIVILPYGVYSGFVSTALPYLLRKAGLPVDRIASISALALSPSVWYFFWAPLVDFALRRRTWLILASASSAALLAAAVLQPLPSGLALFTALLVAGMALNMLVGSATGGLMATTMPDNLRGRAGGWYQAGNLGGGALGAGVTLWLAPRIPIAALAWAVAAMAFLPSLAALGIGEPPAGSAPGREHLGAILGELGAMFRSRRGLMGLAIFMSPMGAAAAMNLFSGIGVDYHASDRTIILINGFAGGILTAAGSLAGGWICDAIDRRLAYAVAALLSALCSAGMLLAPLTERVFAAGVSLYLFTAGIAYAAFSALDLEVIGSAARSAGTQHTLFTASANLPVVYMTWLDGQGYKRFGPRGLLGTDAFSNIAAAAICLLLIRRSLRAKWLKTK
jgi:PAT family beta-lactamase induction signal transducer AmpG